VGFWDTSALVPLCAPEAQTPALQQLRRQDPGIIVWWAAPVESASALQRLIRMGQLDIATGAAVQACLVSLWPFVAQVAPTEAVRTQAERLLARHPLRAADALQLAAALVWAVDRPVGHAVACLDDRLRAAAAREGFVVLP
jgi:uncharacterized protein